MRENFLLILLIFFKLLSTSFSTLRLEPVASEVVRYVNDSFVVSCSDNEKRPVTWKKGNKVILDETGQRYVSRIGTKTALIFEPISAGHGGEYFCVSSNETVSLKLTVLTPINFLLTPSTQTIRLEHSGLIKCVVGGNPKPTNILWNFEGKDLTTSRYQIVKEGLLIKKVLLEDQGQYTCKAYQASLSTSMYKEKNINVIVQHKPMHKTPVHAKVNIAYGYVGGEVNMTCEAIAEPAANFTWLRKQHKVAAGRIINKPHWSLLQLFIHNKTTFGDYVCKAKNQIGLLEQTISLEEGIKPPKPRGLKLNCAGSDNFNLTIIKPDSSQMRQLPKNMLPIGYRIQYRTQGPKTSWNYAGVVDFTDFNEDVFLVYGLVHNTNYELRVATRNPAGLSDYTKVYTFQTLRLYADFATSAIKSYSILYYISLLCPLAMFL